MVLAHLQVPAARVQPPVEAPLVQWAGQFDHVHIDLGTGDGAHALHVARREPAMAVIGIDTNLDHVRGSRKRHPANLRFAQHDARAIPLADLPVADVVTINFPYGSLLRALVEGDPDLLARLDALLGGRMTVRVNAQALAAGGLDADTGPDQIVRALRLLPGVAVTRRALSQEDLRRFPSEWAKRLGYGKPTRSVLIEVAR